MIFSLFVKIKQFVGNFFAEKKISSLQIVLTLIDYKCFAIFIQCLIDSVNFRLFDKNVKM